MDGIAIGVFGYIGHSPPINEVVSEDLGGHDEHIGLGVEFDISREDANGEVGKRATELVELLVGECLDGTGIDDLLSLGAEESDSEFGREGLSGAGVGGHENVVAPHDGGEGVLLEVAEGKWESGEVGRHLLPLIDRDGGTQGVVLF